MVHPSAELPGSAVVIRPGDRVLVGMGDDMHQMDDFDVIAIREQLAARHPGVEFTFIAASFIAVQRAEEANP